MGNNKCKYTYPAIFTEEDNGGYSVMFPDLQGCYTCGDDLLDAEFMAEDALAFTLCWMEKNELDIPKPSDESCIPLKKNEHVQLISCDTEGYVITGE